MDPENLEDDTILAALRELERPDPALPSPPARPFDERAETLRRLYGEVLGLLPYDLEPMTPSPAVKQRLFGSLLGDETQEVVDLPPESAPVAVPVPAPARTERPAPPAPPARRNAARWPLALAAALALALVGVSFWSYQRIDQADQAIARLQGEVNAAGDLRTQLAELRERVNRIDGHLDLVSTPGVTIMTLAPTGDDPSLARARGLLYVAADHQHWYLRVKGLAPAAGEHDYQLWWKTETAAVDGGTLALKPGADVELASDRMPAGTKEVVICLERKGGAVLPTGPVVLHSDQKLDTL